MKNAEDGDGNPRKRRECDWTGRCVTGRAAWKCCRRTNYTYTL